MIGARTTAPRSGTSAVKLAKIEHVGHRAAHMLMFANPVKLPRRPGPGSAFAREK